MMEIRTDANGRKYEYHEESVKNKTELDLLRAEYAALQESVTAKDLLIASLNNAVKTATQSIAELCDENADLTKQLAAANGRIDALMLEYCPEEMTKEQLDIWVAHQRRADLPEADKEKSE